MFYEDDHSMRGLFLDFDGVTHPVSAIKDWRELNIHAADLPNLIQKRDLFRWLHLLADALTAHPDVLIVVHSGWRSVANNILMRQILGESLAERFIGVTSLELDRHAGIQELAKRSGMNSYLIIDDATHEFPLDHPNLIATNPELGLTDPDVIKQLQVWLESTVPDQSSSMTSSMTCR